MLNPIRRRLTLAAIALSVFVALPAIGQTINEDIKLTAFDGAAFDYFSSSIAIKNGVVAVGAYSDDNNNGMGSGSAYLYDATTGTQLFKLLASDGTMGDNFGSSIAIDNGIIAVGAFNDNDDKFNGSGSGSAYLFDASTGAQLFKLLPSDGAAGNPFSWSIAIDNGIVAVGSIAIGDRWGHGFDPDSGAAYLFDASTGAQLFKLLPSDGAADDWFGHSIAIDNGIVAVGAIFDDDNGVDSGSAYLFDASTGAQIAKILPNDGAFDDYFGSSIAINNGVVAVGAIYDGDNGSQSGSVYLFDASTGVQMAKLLANDGVAVDTFGTSIAIDNGIIAIGSLNGGDNGSYSGSAYLFNISNGTQITKLLPSDGEFGDDFGWSIAIDNGVVAVAAIQDDDNGSDSGSAYMFTVPTPCPADLTNDGTLNFFDVSAFITALANNDPIADFNNDGRWNFFDVSAFLQAFAAGCP